MTKCIKETFGHFQRIFETPLLIINVLRFFVVRLCFFKCCFIKKKHYICSERKQIKRDLNKSLTNKILAYENTKSN